MSPGGQGLRIHMPDAIFNGVRVMFMACYKPVYEFLKVLSNQNKSQSVREVSGTVPVVSRGFPRLT